MGDSRLPITALAECSKGCTSLQKSAGARVSADSLTPRPSIRSPTRPMVLAQFDIETRVVRFREGSSAASMSQKGSKPGFAGAEGKPQILMNRTGIAFRQRGPLTVEAPGRGGVADGELIDVAGLGA